jgi:hypothetical protein
LRFSWNIAAVASALTALTLLFPITGSTGCDGSEGPATGCTTTSESILVRYEVSYLAAAAIALGIAILVGATIHLIGRRTSAGNV